MSYTPTVWQTGDTITAEKLNKLENGVGDVFVIDVTVKNDPEAESEFIDYVSATVAECADAVGRGCRLAAHVKWYSKENGDYNLKFVYDAASVSCMPTDGATYIYIRIVTNASSSRVSIMTITGTDEGGSDAWSVSRN